MRKLRNLKWRAGQVPHRAVMKLKSNMGDYMCMNDEWYRYEFGAGVFDVFMKLVKFKKKKWIIFLKKIVYEIYLYDFICGKFAHLIADWLWEKEPKLKS